MSNPLDRRAMLVIALVGAGHGLSHFYQMALPPLFPLLQAEFAVSYTALGALIAALNVVGAAGQVPAGAISDRRGARVVLLFGLAVMALAVALMALANSYWMLLGLIVIAGVGNAVFHPADYLILSQTIDKGGLGRAFALHTFTGNVGMAVAPATVLGLTFAFGWRGALFAISLLGFAVMAALLIYGEALRPRIEAPAGKNASGGGLRPLLSPPILLMFGFFGAVAMVSTGVQTFAVAALVQHQAMSLAGATAALTAYMAASAAGILLGGVLADRTDRHDLVAAGSMVVGAVLFALLGAVQIPNVLIVAALVAIGLLQGALRPARDMMVHALSPPGATGRVFAFVSTGINAGGAIAPIVLGLALDYGRPAWLFYALAAGLCLAFAVILATSAYLRPRAVTSAGAAGTARPSRN